MCRGTIHRNTNKGFDGRWLLVVWGVNEPHVKRGAKRSGGPDYVGAVCFDSSLPFDYAQGKLSDDG